MEELIFRDRRGTNCLKWNHLTENGFRREGLLGMWVADMDIASPRSVREVLREMAEFGVFGYDRVPESYTDAFLWWEKTRHGLDCPREWIRYSPGVVAGFNWLVRILTEPGEAVIIQTPVYYPFSRAVTDNGRKLVTSGLVRKDGRYVVDFEDFERKIRDNGVKAFILCSPHNPVGRVWTEEELLRMLEICRKYGVHVISDEIHQDIVIGDHRQIPTLSLAGPGDRVTALTAASKTFNLAGFRNSFVILPDEEIRGKYDSFTSLLHIGSGSAAGYAAVEAAYRGGGEWLESLLELVRGNYAAVRDCLAERAPEAVVYPLEGTYLAWIDLSAYTDQEHLPDLMENRCGIAADYGVWFGGSSEGFVRLNLATSPAVAAQAASAVADAVSPE